MNDWIADNWTAVLVAQAALLAALLVLALVLLLLWRRSRRHARRAVTARAEAERSLIDLELLAAEQGSRMTIVRELHEVAALGLTGIVGQAEGAAYAANLEPGVAVRAATGIADAARTTLADLRRSLDVLRDGEAAAGPQPKVSSLRELLQIMRDAGLVIEFEESGERFDLKQAAEIAIYRIVQEALANALRHGGEGTTVRLTMAWTASGLELHIDDNGVRAAARRAGVDPDAMDSLPTQEDDLAALTQPPSGRGITDMRERTQLYGGVFTAHALPGVGFAVSAVFPHLRQSGALSTPTAS